MRTTAILASACIVLIAGAPFAAQANEAIAPEKFAKRLLAAPSVEQKTYACFVRRYDTAHLTRHPKQTVTAMKLLVSAERLAEDNEVSYSLTFGINLRNRAGDFVSSESCGRARELPAAEGGTTVHCQDGCEDNGIDVALGPHDKSVMLTFKDIVVWRAGNRNDEDGHFGLTAGADDRLFRLDRADIKDCAALMGEGEDDLAATPTQ